MGENELGIMDVLSPRLALSSATVLIALGLRMRSERGRCWSPVSVCTRPTQRLTQVAYSTELSLTSKGRWMLECRHMMTSNAWRSHRHVCS